MVIATVFNATDLVQQVASYLSIEETARLSLVSVSCNRAVQASLLHRTSGNMMRGFSLTRNLPAFVDTPLAGIGIASDGNIVTCGWRDRIRVIDPKNGECLREFAEESSGGTLLKIALQDVVVAVLSNEQLTVWKYTSGKKVHALEGHTDYINVIDVFPNGCLLTGSYDKTARLWELCSGKCLQTFHGLDKMMGVGHTRDLLPITGTNDGKITIWNQQTGKPLREIRAKRDLRYLHMRSDGELMSIHWNGTIDFWNLGACIKTQHIADGFWMMGSMGDAMIAVASSGRITRIDKGRGERLIGVFHPSSFSLTVSSKGRLYAGAVDGTISVMDFNCDRHAFFLLLMIRFNQVKSKKTFDKALTYFDQLPGSVKNGICVHVPGPKILDVLNFRSYQCTTVMQKTKGIIAYYISTLGPLAQQQIRKNTIHPATNTTHITAIQLYRNSLFQRK